MKRASHLPVSLSLLLTLLLGAPAVAQEEGESSSESFSEQRMVIAAADDEGGMAEIQVFSSSGDIGNTMFVGDGVFPAPDVFSLANNQSVQKEIELVDEQMQQIRDINREFSEKISEQVQSLTQGGMNPERGRELSDLIKKLGEEKKAKMEGVLLPHQFDRLRQIALQTQMQRNGDAATLGSEQVVEALGISEEQKKRIEARAEEIRKELQDKIKELKEKARDELMGELTGQQRAKLDELLGDKFELKTPNLRDRISRMRQNRERTKVESTPDK